jgi:hypothetical protein
MTGNEALLMQRRDFIKEGEYTYMQRHGKNRLLNDD